MVYTIDEFPGTPSPTQADILPLWHVLATLAGNGGSINASQGSFSVSSSADVPVTPFAIKIDSETMMVTTVIGTSWLVQRGINDSTTAKHFDGAAISSTRQTSVASLQAVPRNVVIFPNVSDNSPPSSPLEGEIYNQGITNSGASGGIFYSDLVFQNGQWSAVAGKPTYFRKHIAVIGASTAVGTAATNDNGFVQQLATLLSAAPYNYTFNNGAVGNWNAAQVIAAFWTNAQPFNPDFVLWVWGTTLEPQTDVGYWNAFREVLQFNQVCRQNGAILVLCSIPNSGIGTVPARYNDFQVFRQLLEDYGIPYIDTFANLENGSGGYIPSLTVDGIHCNDLGMTQGFQAIPPTLFDNLRTYDLEHLAPSPQGCLKYTGVFNSLPPPITFTNSGPGTIPIGSYTTACWFRRGADQTGILANPMAVNDGVTSQNRIRMGDTPAVYINRASSGDVVSSTSCIDGLWHHLALVGNYTSQTTSLYMDGVLVATAADIVLANNTTFSLLGNNLAGGFNCVNTEVKDWVVYRCAKTAPQIARLYAGFVEFGSLELYCPMNDGVNSIYAGGRLVNLAPTSSVAIFNSTGFTSANRGPRLHDGIGLNAQYNFYSASQTTVAAAGTNQATATQLTSCISYVTSGTGGVILANVSNGGKQTVHNFSGAPINVYPINAIFNSLPVGGVIDSLGANVPFPLANGCSVTFHRVQYNQFYSVSNFSTIIGTNPGAPAVIVRGAVSQTAAIYQVQNSDGSPILSVNPLAIGADGLTIGDGVHSVYVSVAGATTSSTPDVTIGGSSSVLGRGGDIYLIAGTGTTRNGTLWLGFAGNAQVDGVGNVAVANPSAGSPSITAGFLWAPTVNGTPTGAPSSAGTVQPGVTAAAPFVVDVVGQKVWFNVGGVWRSLGSIQYPAPPVSFDNWWSVYDNVYQDSGLTTPAVGNATPVGGWVDRIGGQAFAQATSGNRFFLTTANGKTRIRGSGATNQGMSSSVSPNGNQSIVLIGSAWENVNTVNRDIDVAIGNSLMTLSQRPDGVAGFIGTAVATRSSWDLNQHVLILVRNGSVWTCYLDGTSIGTLTNAANFGALCIGGSGANNEASHSNYAHILVANRTLNSTEIGQITTWGLTA